MIWNWRYHHDDDHNNYEHLLKIMSDNNNFSQNDLLLQQSLFLSDIPLKTEKYRENSDDENGK